jgi:hypothetical protein
MSPQQMDRTIAQLRLEGVTISVAELFDPSLIDEIDRPRATTAS